MQMGMPVEQSVAFGGRQLADIVRNQQRLALDIQLLLSWSRCGRRRLGDRARKHAKDDKRSKLHRHDAHQQLQQ